MVLNEYKDKVNVIIQNYIDQNKDDNVREMLKYSLEGGKRLRSIIALYIFDNYKQKCDSVVVAIELLHSASLILDDLPCMDNDAYRRNKLSFHKKFGVKNAYLLSNYLFCEFNRIIKDLDNDYILTYVFKKLNLIILGQYYDLNPNKNTNLSLEDKIKNNNLKTTPFFVLSFFIPLFLCNKNVDESLVEEISILFSTSFQIYDDFLDIEQDKKTGNFNHIIMLGEKTSYDLYIKNLDAFKKNIIKLNLKIELFTHIINYLNNKLEHHNNGLQYYKA
jgi:geranylgeranyl diphosphate synthase, type II